MLTIDPKATDPYERFLVLQNPARTPFKNQLLELLLTKSVVPGFSATTFQLVEAAQNPNTSVSELAAIVSYDPALTLRCIKAATSVGAGGRNITTIEQAMMYIGVREMQRLAVGAEVMDRFNDLHVKVNWNEFWLHSLLVARLTEKIAACFRNTRGIEYLAGLMHDVGKLVLTKYFPRQFEEVLNQSAATREPHHVVEAEVLGLDHAQVGAAVCSAMGVSARVLNGVHYHHRPTSTASCKAPMAENGFMAACVAVANAVAKICESGFHCNEEMPPLEELEEWQFLGNFDPVAPLDIDVGTERDHAEADLKALLGA